MFAKKISLIAAISVIISFISHKEVNADHQVKYNDVAPATTEIKFKFTLSNSIPHIKANIAHNYNYKGKSSYVVVIDTGIEAAHPFFGGRVSLEACFAPSCPDGTKQMIGKGAARPVHWHGTHVAGIIAGSNSAFVGVAPESNIIAINIFDVYGGAYDSDITKALNWVNEISSQYNIASVNMSLGGTQIFNTTCDGYLPEMTDAIKNLRSKNIATVISSGNSYAKGMSAPACVSYAVSVAATNSTNDEVTTFSNISDLTTIAAPGANIASAALMGSYRAASGTSMAAPHVAGAFAVYNSKYGKQSVSKVIADFYINSPKAYDTYTKTYINRLDFNNLFSSSDTPVTTTTIPSPTTTNPSPTTTIPSPTTTNPPVTTTTIPSPGTTVAPPKFYPTLTKPLLYELDGRYTTFTYIKYRVPVVGRNIVSHYNLHCNGPKVYKIPHQIKWTVDTYKLEVPTKEINICYMTAIDIYGRESDPSMFVRIYPRNKP